MNRFTLRAPSYRTADQSQEPRLKRVGMSKKTNSIVVFDLPAEPIKLELFDEVPVGRATVHAAEDDSNAPIICKGEIAIIEGSGKAGWLPEEDGLFLIEHISQPSPFERYERRTRTIVQTYRNSQGEWLAGSVRRGLCADGAFYCADGPYRDEAELADKLVGKVVGLLACTLKQRRV